MISREEVEKLAELARLTVSPDEVAKLQKDISSILDYVGQVSKVEAPSHTEVVPDNHNAFRADVPREEGDLLSGKEEVLRAAFPKREGDYNAVRQILQKDE